MDVQLNYTLNTFSLLMAAVLVIWMSIGLTLFHVGLVRTRNTAAVITKDLLLFSLASIVFVTVGYNLMYLGNAAAHPYFPHLTHWFSDDFTLQDRISQHSSHAFYAEILYQMSLAAVALLVVVGATAERLRIWPTALFAIFFVGLIYPLAGYWVWNGGFLSHLGFFDFAGAGVVHLTGAAAGLAGILVIGPRLGRFPTDGIERQFQGAVLPLALLGGLMMCLGAFGINAGMQFILSSRGDINTLSLIFVNTLLTGAAGFVVSLMLTTIAYGKSDLTLGLNGMLAAIVAIAAWPDVSPSWAVSLGAVAGALVMLGNKLFEILRIDDPVGAVLSHGLGGILGLLAVAYSNQQVSFWIQCLGVVVIFAWSFCASWLVWQVLKWVIGLRPSKQEEILGLDLLECGMEAYPGFTKKYKV